MKKQKISIFLTGISGIVLVYVLDFLYRKTVYVSSELYRNYIEPLFYIFLFLSILSFMFGFLKDEIFKTWSKFTYVWIPISIILTLVTPGGSGSFFVSLWDQQMTAIFMSSLYFIISIIIILIKLIKPSWNK